MTRLLAETSILSPNQSAPGSGATPGNDVIYNLAGFAVDPTYETYSGNDFVALRGLGSTVIFGTGDKIVKPLYLQSGTEMIDVTAMGLLWHLSVDMSAFAKVRNHGVLAFDYSLDGKIDKDDMLFLQVDPNTVRAVFVLGSIRLDIHDDNGLMADEVRDEIDWEFLSASKITGDINGPLSIRGTSADDILFGAGVTAVIDGRGGEDILVGSAAAETIRTSGNDHVVMFDGGGSDTLVAGDGPTDIYLVRDALTDTVKNFVPGQTHLNIQVISSQDKADLQIHQITPHAVTVQTVDGDLVILKSELGFNLGRIKLSALLESITLLPNFESVNFGTPHVYEGGPFAAPTDFKFTGKLLFADANQPVAAGGQYNDLCFIGTDAQRVNPKGGVNLTFVSAPGATINVDQGLNSIVAGYTGGGTTTVTNWSPINCRLYLDFTSLDDGQGGLRFDSNGDGTVDLLDATASYLANEVLLVFKDGLRSETWALYNKDGINPDDINSETIIFRDAEHGNPDGVIQRDGTKANDILAAAGVDSRVLGKSGDDYVGGGPGDDDLFGGRGNDDMYDRGGSDLLYGGPGDDRFFMDNDGIMDFIRDLEAGDKIVFLDIQDSSDLQLLANLDGTVSIFTPNDETVVSSMDGHALSVLEVQQQIVFGASAYALIDPFGTKFSF